MKIIQTLRRYIFVGLLALIPAWITILLIGAILKVVREQIAPFFDQLLARLDPGSQTLLYFASQAWFQTIVTVVLMLAFFCLIGWLMSLWIGQKAMHLVDLTMERIPLAKSVYSAIKGVTNAFERNDGKNQRVVLIDFPMTGMKTIGLITNTLKDAKSGRDLAVVFVPTSPNPTGGYLEILPLDDLTQTNWTVEEAMSFLMSGGTDVSKGLSI